MYEILILAFSSIIWMPIIITGLITICFFSWTADYKILSSIISVGFFVLLWNVDIINYNNVTNIICYLLGYILIGGIFSIWCWFNFLNNQVIKVKQMFDYVKEHSNVNLDDTPIKSNNFITILLSLGHRVPFYNDKTFANKLRNELYNAYQRANSIDNTSMAQFKDKYPNLYQSFIEAVTPNVSNFLGMVFAWIVYWPGKLLVDLCSDYLYRSITWCISKCQSIYNRMARKAFDF